MANNVHHKPKGKKPIHPRSRAAFCARYGICLATFHNLVNRGELETTKIGSRTIVTEEQEHAWLERNKRSA